MAGKLAWQAGKKFLDRTYPRGRKQAKVALDKDVNGYSLMPEPSRLYQIR